MLLDDGQTAVILRNKSLEHVIRSYWRIAPSDSASKLEAKVREKNNLPFGKVKPNTINCLQPEEITEATCIFSLIMSHCNIDFGNLCAADGNSATDLDFH